MIGTYLERHSFTISHVYQGGNVPPDHHTERVAHVVVKQINKCVEVQ